jgi:SWI/SNF-related matrix-associated actin-dependent regulator 1 of chromatin subfamily A
VDCNSNQENCLDDETTLLQFRQTLTKGADKQDPTYTFEQSAVETAQDNLKAATSDRSIQMYAASQARLEEAKALWAATKAHFHAKTATLDEINAERAAAAAVQAAQDEADAWAESVFNLQEADNQTAIAEADWSIKHSITKAAAATAQSATKMRASVEESAKVNETFVQDVVNDAQAEATAKYSFDAKVAAAARVADQKAAYSMYKQKRTQNRDAQKTAWQTKQKAWKDEWKANRQAQKAQRKAMKAAGAGVTGIVKKS